MTAEKLAETLETSNNDNKEPSATRKLLDKTLARISPTAPEKPSNQGYLIKKY